ncbi:MAG: tyrosine-type recombinase/integrase [Lachnospiraceae bacterium]|nr:tyrosine-type recombinase/integrase [Lachnospiraceae bacterium]
MIDKFSFENILEVIYFDLEDTLYNLFLAERRFYSEIVCYPEKEEKFIEEYNSLNRTSLSLKFLAEYVTAKLTVLALVEKYISLRTGVRPSTAAGYKTVTNILKKDNFGKKRIDKVKISDAKQWLIQLQKNGRGFSSIHTIRGVLRPAFQLAVDDDLIRKNPFAFEIMTVIYNDSVTREALSYEDERKFLKFVKEDDHFSKYYDGIYILFNTGLRISEFVGLTISDIEFDKRRIKVDHQLQRYNGIGKVIVEPKTESGNRYVPMNDEVIECFKRIIQNRKKPKAEPMIDGYVGFLFLDKDDEPMVAMHWEKYFQHICQKYNSIYRVQMPKVTPHVCRHTFCSRMAAARMNPKTLQYIMGHSDISVTLNTYTHLGFDDASEELDRIYKEKASKKVTNVSEITTHREKASNE